MTFDDLHLLISQRENSSVEFKAEVSEDVLRGLSTDIAALANSRGGMIIFGVTDDQDPRGCDLQGDEREKISQRASNCRPAVKIDFEEILFGPRHFLIVNVPRSTVVHSDIERRFPVRIGNITDYLDALGLVALLQERGLLRGDETEQLRAKARQEREPIPDSEVSVFIRVLNSEDRDARLEALKDLDSLVYRYVLLENESVANILERILRSEREHEIQRVLAVLRSVANSGTPGEKETVLPWMGKIAEIAMASHSAAVSREAFDVLQIARREAVVDVLVHWITKADDAHFERLQPANMLGNVKFYGLDGPIRDAMYTLLERQSDKNVRKRAMNLLEAVRRAYS
jgi:hypothetical protein